MVEPPVLCRSSRSFGLDFFFVKDWGEKGYFRITMGEDDSGDRRLVLLDFAMLLQQDYSSLVAGRRG